jgi:hypothetical protein
MKDLVIKVAGNLIFNLDFIFIPLLIVFIPIPSLVGQILIQKFTIFKHLKL